MDELRVDFGSLDDWKLVERLQKGERAAFRPLVGRYKDKVYNTIFRMTGDAAAAEDITQDTFLKAFKAIGNFKKQSQFSTWIYRIAVNSCLTKLRQAKTAGFHTAVSLDHDGGAEGGKMDVAGRAVAPGERLERGEREQAIQKAIASLTEDLRQIVVLKDIENLSYEEIADTAEIPVGTVKSRLFKAREILRARLKGILQ